MKARRWLLIGILLLVSSSCATAPTGPPALPAVDVTGTWDGSWYGQYGSGTISLTLQQTGSKVEGEMRLAGGPSELRSAPVTGTVSGNVLAFTSSGPFRADLTVKSDEMDGPFTYRYLNTMSLRRKR